MRVILAAMQLAGIVDSYRAESSDTDVAEALHRWDEGARVADIGGFERKIIDGQRLIVYAGTEIAVDGMDISLKGDDASV